MKKKIIIAIAIVIAVVLLFPIPLRLKDGGTVKYQAILYSISDVHRSAPLENDVGYEDGIIIGILGMEVFNNVALSSEQIPSGDEAPNEEYDLIPMVKIDGVLYLDTGFRRSETWSHTDGEITSQVAGSQQPTENDQSNFGTGYAYRFAEKDDKTCATELYSLASFSPRKGENVRKGYLQGRFGAIPFIGGDVQ